jgi:hypothetical protein
VLVSIGVVCQVVAIVKLYRLKRSEGP